MRVMAVVMRVTHSVRVRASRRTLGRRERRIGAAERHHALQELLASA